MENPQLIVIDGCALPADLYNQAREQAIVTRTTQCIGVLYDAPPRPQAPPDNPFAVADLILTPSPFFADLRAGRHCRYLMGCTRDELRTCDCAYILHITPRAEAVDA
jgi:hypothetical protein